MHCDEILGRHQALLAIYDENDVSHVLSYTHIHRLSCRSSIVLPVWRYGRCAAESPHMSIAKTSKSWSPENKSHRLRQDSRNRSSSTPWNTLKFCGSDTQDRNSAARHMYSHVLK